MTLIEVLIVVSILGLMSAAIAVAVLPVSEDAKREHAAQNARSLRGAALQWRSTLARTGCPSMAQLQQDKVIDRSSKADDPWGRGYRIQCDDDEVYVSSLGKDGKEGSPDDITEPARPPQ